MKRVYWQLCDSDAPIGTSFREGEGIEQLVDALKDLMAHTEEHTPSGYIPSGNISLYWNEDKRKLRAV